MVIYVVENNFWIISPYFCKTFGTRWGVSGIFKFLRMQVACWRNCMISNVLGNKEKQIFFVAKWYQMICFLSFSWRFCAILWNSKVRWSILEVRRKIGCLAILPNSFFYARASQNGGVREIAKASQTKQKHFF